MKNKLLLVMVLATGASLHGAEYSHTEALAPQQWPAMPPQSSIGFARMMLPVTFLFATNLEAARSTRNYNIFYRGYSEDRLHRAVLRCQLDYARNARAYAEALILGNAFTVDANPQNFGNTVSDYLRAQGNLRVEDVLRRAREVEQSIAAILNESNEPIF